MPSVTPVHANRLRRKLGKVGWGVGHTAFAMASTSDRLSQGQEGDLGGPMEASGCSGCSAPSLLPLAEGRLSGPGTWCCLWALEGGKRPKFSHLNGMIGFEVTLGRELLVVHHSHPTQQVQVLRQVHQLLARREAQHVTHRGHPCCDRARRGPALGHSPLGTPCLCRESRWVVRRSSPSLGPPAAAGRVW